MKIFLTGATGFIGKNLCQALLTAGYEVIAVVRKLADVKQFPTHSLLTVHAIGNICDVKDWSELIGNSSIVIHVAGCAHQLKWGTSRYDDYYEVNTRATRSLFTAAQQANVKKFIFMSSIKVTELLQTRGDTNDPYASSKLNAERLMETLSIGHDMQYLIIRSPVVYGNGVKANFKSLLQLVNAGVPLPLGRVDNKRSFIYLENLVSAIMATLEPHWHKNKIYTVTDGAAISTPELIRTISEVQGVKVKLFPFPVKILQILGLIFGFHGKVQRLVSSLYVKQDDFSTDFSWAPPYTLEQGLKNTIN